MRQRLILVFCVAAIVSLGAGFLAGCGREESGENILARVDGLSISLDDFRREWTNQPPPSAGVPPERVERFLDDMIAERLFLLEARRRKVDRDEDLRREVERYREQLMVEKLLGQEVLTVPAVSPAEVEEFWAAHRELFAVPELIRLSHILIRPGEDESEEEVIERVREIKIQLEGGADFAELAQEVSDGSSAVRSGDLGYFREEQILPEFRIAAGELARGEISDPIGTEYGYHLLTVTDLKPPRQKTLEESRQEVTAILLAEKRKTRFESVRAALAETSSIRKNHDLIEHLQVEQNRALFSAPGSEMGSR